MRLRSKYAIEDLVAGSAIASVVRMPVEGEDQSIGGHRGWRSILRPFSLSLLGLAIGIFLWELAYKLCLYHSQQESGVRTGVAKMWVDPRPHLSVPKSGKSSERTTSDPQLILTDQRLPYSHATNYATATLAVDGRFRSLLTALRSPPPRFIEVRAVI